jgi:hypothetical protein
MGRCAAQPAAAPTDDAPVVAGAPDPRTLIQRVSDRPDFPHRANQILLPAQLSAKFFTTFGKGHLRCAKYMVLL